MMSGRQNVYETTDAMTSGRQNVYKTIDDKTRAFFVIISTESGQTYNAIISNLKILPCIL